MSTKRKLTDKSQNLTWKQIPENGVKSIQKLIQIKCSTDNAAYLKLLLVSASSQGKLKKGMFIPTGLQLLEGKEVVEQILKEQQVFTESHTSFQIEGVSTDGMDTTIGDTGKTIRDILLTNENIIEIEKHLLQKLTEGASY